MSNEREEKIKQIKHRLLSAFEMLGGNESDHLPSCDDVETACEDTTWAWREINNLYDRYPVEELAE